MRSSTNAQMDDCERAIDDAVSVYKASIKNTAFLAGAGACETSLSTHLQSMADTRPGLEQYSISAFARALTVVPTTLAENAGFNHTEILATVQSANTADSNMGVDIETGKPINATQNAIYDHLHSKLWALKLAADCAITILRVDHIIMSKPAGGPKPQQNKNWDED